MSHLRVFEGGATSWSLVLVLCPTSSYVVCPPKIGGQNGGQRPPKEHNSPPKMGSLYAVQHKNRDLAMMQRLALARSLDWQAQRRGALPLRRYCRSDLGEQAEKI